jgi:hypothetical protein
MWNRALHAVSVAAIILMVVNFGLIGAAAAGIVGAGLVSLALAVVISGLVVVPPAARAIALRYANPRHPDGPEADYHERPD